MNLLNSAKEMLGVVLFRFPLVQRTWAALLIAVNLASVFFLDTRFGQAALASIAVAVVTMLFIHARHGFVRLLGIGHVLWIPMLIWFVAELPTVEPGLLRTWLIAVIALDAISLVIDTVDVIRWVRGERAPHYSWEPADAGY